MTCSGAYSTAQEYADFWCLDPICAEEVITINSFLLRAASPINVSRRTIAACDCSITTDVNEYLKTLNTVLAAVMYNCPCGNARLTTDVKRMWMEWIQGELGGIRTGLIELCEGETGSEYPAMGWAEQGVTDFAAAQIIWNDVLRNSGG